MNSQALKQAVAQAALDYIEENSVIGVGTGSTVNYFIEAIASLKHRISGAVASSLETEARLKQAGIPVLDANMVDDLGLYIDGADAFTVHRQLIKGKGGALAREKVLATASRRFICIVEGSKQTKILGNCPVPVEVLPMARSFVAREIVKLGGQPNYRQGFVTDNGNLILDVDYEVISEPLKLEYTLNNIPGVVCNGIFAERTADKILISHPAGISVLENGR